MKPQRLAICFNLLLLIAFGIFISAYEQYSLTQKQDDVDSHAQVIAYSVWTLFTPVTEQYLSLAVENQDYHRMRIFSMGEQELYSHSHQLSGFEATLFDLELIRIDTLQAEIFYKDRHIGTLEVQAYNKNIYLYSYLLLILLLLGLLAWFIAAIYNERKNLRHRVEEKTAELEQNNRKLQDEIAERKKSEQTFLALFDNSFQVISLLDPEGRVCKSNQTSLKVQHLAEEDVAGKYFWETPWWDNQQHLIEQLKAACNTARNGRLARFEAHFKGKRDIYVDTSLKPVFDENHQVINLIAEGRDISDIRQAEQELQQAQKMESVGTLAGGIAHDFNNILGGILGTLSLLKLKREKGEKLSEERLFGYLDTITETALRATEMVTQLLTLSRRRKLKFSPENLYQILQNVCGIASTSFDKSVVFNVQIEEQIPVHADANSLEQVFLNICINAAHAMTIMRAPGEAWGGTLKISQKKVQLEEQPGRAAGSYWCITISDSGVGMNNSELEQIFVPFFTTKDKDAGSGLGLSMVYNIIKQHKGFIEVDSQTGVGTSFHIFLPVATEQIAPVVDQQKPALVTGEGLILVIDDEELIRDNAADMLEECGYQVLTAADGRQGVELYRQQQHEISAVLLDLVMPVMTGKEAFLALKQINPQVKVLLSSGFRQDTRVDEILTAGAVGFIQKPYSLYDLSRTISQILDQSKQKAG